MTVTAIKTSPTGVIHTKMTRGVVYIAAGSKYVEEARRSASSLREHHPELPITLYSDDHPNDDPPNSEVFDNIIIKDNFGYHTGDSILSDEMFPYDHNLYLDTDTYVCGELTDLFEVLNRFDLAVSFGSGRERIDNLPSTLPEYNTGVIAYNDSPETHQLFEKWRKFYDNNESNGFRNQEAFSRSLWETDVDFLVLPQEYNVRIYPGRGAYLTHPAKIMHGRHSDGLKKCAKIANSTDGPRLYYQTWYVIYNFKLLKQKNRGNLVSDTFEYYKENGFYDTLKKGYSKLL